MTGSRMKCYCVMDYCGAPFDPSIPETRDLDTLKPFWYRYCPEHRALPKGQRREFIEEIPATEDYI